MKYNMYSLKDENVGFGVIMLHDNDAVAMRALLNAVQIDNSIYQTAPADFTLYRLGVFDTSNGSIKRESTPVKVCSCVDFGSRDPRKDV